MRLLPLIAGALLLAAVPSPLPAAAPPGGGGGPPPPGPRDRCPVCGMFVAPYREWIAVAQAPGGSPLFFDGPKDLFRFLSRKDGGGTRTPWVTDYYRVRLIPAEGAWFVTGSDVTGPMGHELVPLASEEEAREFLRDHKGKRMLRPGEITPALLEELR